MKYENFTLYPAIDIKNGKCVRLLFGDMERETVYHENPLDQAMWFVDQGAEWLHIVDLDGAVEGKNVNKSIIQKMLKLLQNKVHVQGGGGIRNLENATHAAGRSRRYTTFLMVSALASARAETGLVTGSRRMGRVGTRLSGND